MAKEVITRLVCDVGERHDGTHTATFEVNGQVWELDLCDKHGDQFDKDMSKWTGMSSKVNPNRRKSPKKATAGGVDLAAVRRWASLKGVPVATRGNIPKTVIEQWQKDGAPTG